MHSSLPLISIIVPLYNNEKYIKKCLESLVNQTYTNIEVIIINDGSTDKSQIIVNQFTQNDKRFICRNFKNEGLSVARNRGLLLARGDYIFFLDSDDYLLNDALNLLYEEQKKSNADIVVSCPFLIQEDININLSKENHSLEKELVTGVELLDKLSTNWIYAVSWGKLYKKNIFDKIKFIPKRQHEDELIIHHLLLKANIVSVIPNQLYFYRKHSDSIMSRSPLIKKLDFLYAMNDRYSLCDCNQLESAKVDVARNVIYFCRNILSVKNIKKCDDETFLTLMSLLSDWGKRESLLMSSCQHHVGRRAIARKIIYLGNKNREKQLSNRFSIVDAIVFFLISIKRVVEKISSINKLTTKF